MPTRLNRLEKSAFHLIFPIANEDVGWHTDRMKNLQKFGLPVVGCAMLVFGGLWIAEHQSNVNLTRELGASRDQLTAKEAELQGLLAANERLQLRLQEIPVLALFDEEAGDGVSVDGMMTLSPAVWDEFTQEEQPIVLNADGTQEIPAVQEPEKEAPQLTPEQIAEREAIKAERAEKRLAMRERMNNALQDRREFFSLINTEGLAPEYVESNERVVEAMGEMQVMLLQMGVEGLSNDERHKLYRGMRKNAREVNRLMQKQKDVLLHDYAELELGLKGRQKKDFIEYMKTVDSYTSLPHPNRRMTKGQ